MNTEERLKEYRKLEGEEAAKFLQENSHDKRFVSLIKLKNEFFASFEEYYERHNSGTSQEAHGPI